MATNILTQNPFSATGVRPGQWFLTSSEDYATLTAPGYLNSVSQAGYEFQPNDMVFAQYSNGVNFDIFVVSVDGGIFTMNVYNPNSNSFIFSRVQFVAKGGSDLNAGTSIGLPKLTIQAAIDALSLSPSNTGVVWVMDDATYIENLVIPFNMQLFAPNAIIKCTSGDLITINDTGMSTLSSVSASRLINTGAGLSINILGAQSSMFLSTQILQGGIYLEGTLIDGKIAQLTADIHVASSGVLAIEVVDAIAYTLTVDSGGKVYGPIQSLADEINYVYGDQTFKNHIIYQTAPSTETSGRTLSVFDGNKRIVYNSASPANYVLSQTSDVAIPIGTNIEFTQLGLGAAVFVAGSGVTIVSALGATVETNGSGSSCKAWKYTDTIWVISGDIAAVGP